jgi:hypothetical protein
VGDPCTNVRFERRATCLTPTVADLRTLVPAAPAGAHGAIANVERLVSEGVDLRPVQAFADHESNTRTMRYLHAMPDADERIRNAMRRLTADSDAQEQRPQAGEP